MINKGRKQKAVQIFLNDTLLGTYKNMSDAGREHGMSITTIRNMHVSRGAEKSKRINGQSNR